MGFAKGQSGNQAGRPVGVKNKITKQLRNALKTVIADELEQVPALLEGLEPQVRLEILIKLLPYCFPKIENVRLDKDEESTEFTIV